MVPAPCSSVIPIPPPSYQRAQAKAPPALHLDALTLVTRLHLLILCRLAVRLAQRRCPPPLPAGPGGHPRVYSEASLVLLALLRTLWRLSRPRYARLVAQLACAGARVWVAPRCSWSAAYPVCFPAVEA